MSSEMRDIKALVDLVVGCISNGRRDEALLHAEQTQNALARALLARTEAGADGGAPICLFDATNPCDGTCGECHHLRRSPREGSNDGA